MNVYNSLFIYVICSNNIFIPIIINIIPPRNIALFLYLLPNKNPTLEPIVDVINVIIVIKNRGDIDGFDNYIF